VCSDFPAHPIFSGPARPVEKRFDVFTTLAAHLLFWVCAKMRYMSDDEKLEIVDEQGNPLGIVTREEAERKNHITQNVLVFVFTQEGKIWAQKRPLSKKHYPGLWDISACGGIVFGEMPNLSALRETQEEMGITCELHFVDKFLNQFKGEDGSKRQRFSHLFVGITDQEPIVSPEVDEFKCLTYDELKEKIKSHPEHFVPSFLLELEKAYTASKKMSWF